MLCVWRPGTHGQRLSAGKRVCTGPQASQSLLGPRDVNTITVAAIKTNAAVIKGEIGGIAMDMMLDSGSAVSLVRRETMKRSQDIVWKQPTPGLQLAMSKR